jgi:ribosome biogenesis GTPase|tara:strand:- start:3815 stop:4708 length:894 start_codon:yes stop_codon:yes gene_type:complete
MKESKQSVSRIANIYGNHGLLIDSNNQTHKFMLKNSKTKLYVGDCIETNEIIDEVTLIDKPKERINVVERFDKLGKKQIVAANVTQLLIVIAPEPQPNFLLLDKLLLVSELMKNQAAIIYNKNDLGRLTDNRILKYKKLGYKLINMSAKSNNNFEQFYKQLMNQTSFLVGQSGVGKSTITNMLLNNQELKTKTLSSKTKKGRHTTSTTSLYQINSESFLIDTPGVENLHPAIENAQDIQLGFKEMKLHIGKCKYRDCIHISEPLCSVKDHLSKNEIEPSRYENYKKLVVDYKKTSNP